jgi:hypothetical protein
MGYDTILTGQINLDPPLNASQVRYLRRFNKVYHVARWPRRAAEIPDPWREAAGLPIGPGGGGHADYFTGAGAERWPHSVDDDFTVIGHGRTGRPQRNDKGEVFDVGHSQPQPESGAPCWEPSDDGKTLTHDGSEKSYDYDEWLTYVIDHFLSRWGIVARGVVRYVGEDPNDVGHLVVAGNKVEVRAMEWPSIDKEDQ